MRVGQVALDARDHQELRQRPCDALPQLVAAFDARWNLDTDGDTGRYGGGLEYFVTTAGGQSGYPLRAGAGIVVGSIAFGISAFAAKAVGPTGDLRNVALMNLGTFVGALCFLAGAVLLIPDEAAQQ